MATIGDCARHLFLSERRFQEFLNSGVLDRQSRGAYDLDAVREQYIRHLRELAAGRGSDGDLDLTEERARLAKEQADAQEMKNSMMRGELLPAEHVEKTWANMVTMATNRLYGIPSIVAPRIQPSMKPADVEALIREQIDDAMRALSGARVRVVDDDSAGGEPDAGALEGEPAA